MFSSRPFHSLTLISKKVSLPWQGCKNPPKIGGEPEFRCHLCCWLATDADQLRGAVQKNFGANLGFCPNRLGPPPSPNVGTPTTQKKIWCLFCILGYSKHIIFSWKSPIFWVKRVGTGTPPSPLIWILSQVYPKFDRLFLAHFLGGPINYWIDEILPPHLCTMCFITFMDSSKAN